MAARTFRRFKFSAPRIRSAGNLCTFGRAGWPERQQGVDCRHAASFADRPQCDRPGFQVAGAKSQAGSRTIGRADRTPKPAAHCRRKSAKRKSAAPFFATSAWLEGTHSRIEAATFADQTIAFADRRLDRPDKFQKTGPEIRLVEASAPNGSVKEQLQL